MEAARQKAKPQLLTQRQLHAEMNDEKGAAEVQEQEQRLTQIYRWSQDLHVKQNWKLKR
jgi:hypothetical protein